MYNFKNKDAHRTAITGVLLVGGVIALLVGVPISTMWITYIFGYLVATVYVTTIVGVLLYAWIYYLAN